MNVIWFIHYFSSLAISVIWEGSHNYANKAKPWKGNEALSNLNTSFEQREEWLKHVKHVAEDFPENNFKGLDTEQGMGMIRQR